MDDFDWIKKHNLQQKQESFVLEYLINGSATEALKKSKYKYTSKKAARVNASRLLKVEKVAAAIAEGRKIYLKAKGFEQAQILDELIAIAGSNIKNFVKWGSDGINIIDSDQIDNKLARAIIEVSETPNGKKIKMYSKMDALKTLGSFYGMWKNVSEISGKDGEGIPVNVEKVKSGDMSDVELDRVIKKMLRAKKAK